MIHRVSLVLQNDAIQIDLDDDMAPKTVKAILAILPVSFTIHAWGEELYTEKIPVDVKPENAKSLVDIMDVAFWPPGNALCFFFGPTPIGNKGEIKPYSPVNVIGRMIGKVSFPKDMDGIRATLEIVY
jgi:hypothetical protein